MNILTILPTYLPHTRSTLGTYHHALHKALIKEGHTVVVRTMNDDGSWTHQGVEVNPATHEDYDLIITPLNCYQNATHWNRTHGTTHPVVLVQHDEDSWAARDEALYRPAGIIYTHHAQREEGKSKAAKKYVLTPLATVRKQAPLAEAVEWLERLDVPDEPND